MKRHAAALLSVLLLASPALAATSLDALRVSARGAREQVSRVRAEQLGKRNELSTLSARIEQLKAESKGRLLPGGELDSALKASQALSGSLTDLARELSTRESELEAANLKLLDGLSGELTRLRADFDRQTRRDVRRGLIESMRRVRAERDALRSTLPAAKVPTMAAVKPSDDPEELLEQADLMRDTEEKLAKELKALDTRIAERREEVELDRRMQRFMGEESMFDDQDRRLRLQRTESANALAATTTPSRGGAESETGADEMSPGAFGSPEGSNSRGPNEAGGSSSPTWGGYDTGGVSVRSGSDARPVIGDETTRLTGGDGDLDELEVQRLRIQGLMQQAHDKAGELEARAAELH